MVSGSHSPPVQDVGTEQSWSLYGRAHLTSLRPPPHMKCLNMTLVHSLSLSLFALQGPTGASGPKGDMVKLLAVYILITYIHKQPIASIVSPGGSRK